MKKLKLFTLVIVLMANFNLSAQLAITTDGSAPDASAMLDVKSNDKGILVPRITQSQIQSIAFPADGLLVFNTDDNHHYFFDAGAGEWKEIAMGTGTITPIPPWNCGDALLDGRDGQSYNTVLIGTQCWMAENLNTGTRIDGVNNQTDNSILEKYCYDNNTANCDIYGGLYQWDEMMQYETTAGIQGICPDGWHLPTDDEWKILEGTTDTQYGIGHIEWDGTSNRGFDSGKHIKSMDGWAVNTGADSYGFSALPGGYFDYVDTFFFHGGNNGNWSSSTESGSLDLLKRMLTSYSDEVYRSINNKHDAFSVRCLHD